MDNPAEGQRLQAIVSAMNADGLDALLVVSPTGTFYLSGCYLLTQTMIPERQAYVILRNDGRASYLVCDIEENTARHDSWIQDIHTYVEFEQTPVAALVNLLARSGLSRARLGVEFASVPFASLRYLQEELTQCHFVPWDQTFGRLLMRKEAGEISAIEKAGRLTQAAIEAGLTEAAPGCTELDIANQILAGLMAHGAMPLFNVFASGPKAMMVHAEPTARVLQAGDIVRLDMGGRFPNHYLSDMARTAVVGEPSPRQSSVYERLFRAQQAVFSAVRPGLRAGDLYAICKKSFHDQDLAFQMPHIGHGFGLGLHEAPMIYPGNETLLEPGMVLNIEPFVAIPEHQESYHIEDLVTVTPSGSRLLTTPQPTLLRIPA